MKRNVGAALLSLVGAVVITVVWYLRDSSANGPATFVAWILALVIETLVIACVLFGGWRAWTTWCDVRSLADQMRLLESELGAKIEAARAENKQGYAELRLDFEQQFSSLRRRVERLEEARGSIRP